MFTASNKPDSPAPLDIASQGESLAKSADFIMQMVDRQTRALYRLGFIGPDTMPGPALAIANTFREKLETGTPFLNALQQVISALDEQSARLAEHTTSIEAQIKSLPEQLVCASPTSQGFTASQR